MKKQFILVLASVIFLSACGARRPLVQPTLTPISSPTASVETATPYAPVASTATAMASATQRATSTPRASSTPQATATALPIGPDNFTVNVDPLTGLTVTDPQALTRRPVVIKVENIPREHRPQWGLSLADLVYEYYTEFGATRFAAVYYGSDAERVGPIRSGRFFDVNIVQMYKAVLVYGSAYTKVQERFLISDFANRLILENNRSCPSLCRYEPNGQNLLVSNTGALAEYLKTRSVDNARQDLNGMLFDAKVPAGGDAANSVYLRYSGAIYNRWDYDPAAGRYLRFADKQNDVNRNNEVYEQLTDRLTGQPIAASTMVTLCVPHSYYAKTVESEVIEILMAPGGAGYVGCDGQRYAGGSGAAYVARDGKMYKVTWNVAAKNKVLTLLNADGTLFPFKPGQTWFEVIGASSKVDQQADGSWRFTHLMAP